MYVCKQATRKYDEEVEYGGYVGNERREAGRRCSHRPVWLELHPSHAHVGTLINTNEHVFPLQMHEMVATRKHPSTFNICMIIHALDGALSHSTHLAAPTYIPHPSASKRITPSVSF